MNRSRATLSDADFEGLLEMRDGLRRFLHWSEDRARAVGLTAAQHQLLLAVRGHGTTPSIGDLADHLLLRHHSVVELVDRAERAGLVRRYDDEADQRVVRVRLTRTGASKLTSLAAAHIEELASLRSSFASIWDTEPAPSS